MFLPDNEEVLFVGDLHGDIGDAKRVVEKCRDLGIKTIIQLGDFGIYKSDQRFLRKLNVSLTKNGIMLYFIDGNHEDFPYLYSFPVIESGTRPIMSNITHLPRGFVFSWGELNLMSLGGAFSVDKDFRTEGIDWFEFQEVLSRNDIEGAIRNASGKKIDILLTHDSPASCPNNITDNPVTQARAATMFGIENINESNLHRQVLDIAYNEIKPTFVFHGHYHDFFFRNAPYGYVACLNEGSQEISSVIMPVSIPRLRELFEDRWPTN